MIFFQGSEDKIVPPNQAEAMVAALRDKGIPVAYILFDGEGHGFRQAANIKRNPVASLYGTAKSRHHGFKLVIPGSTGNDNFDVPRLLRIKPDAEPLHAAALMVPAQPQAKRHCPA